MLRAPELQCLGISWTTEWKALDSENSRWPRNQKDIFVVNEKANSKNASTLQTRIPKPKRKSCELYNILQSALFDTERGRESNKCADDRDSCKIK
jgi:hypothetical protein